MPFWSSAGRALPSLTPPSYRVAVTLRWMHACLACMRPGFRAAGVAGVPVCPWPRTSDICKFYTSSCPSWGGRPNSTDWFSLVFLEHTRILQIGVVLQILQIRVVLQILHFALARSVELLAPRAACRTGAAWMSQAPVCRRLCVRAPHPRKIVQGGGGAGAGCITRSSGSAPLRLPFLVDVMQFLAFWCFSVVSCSDFPEAFRRTPCVYTYLHKHTPTIHRLRTTFPNFAHTRAEIHRCPSLLMLVKPSL